ncbi:hypothetical protein BJ878DRAFT_525118 [Calycina marina]|uniref:Uncharacterized protein n=1 Tax=Calycina marina TaxID=1763456 RepID=A0A9P7YWQ0_9HELO|nr:hypothetical protein BJ878DRAFT_525118 [Calycina marina]
MKKVVEVFTWALQKAQTKHTKVYCLELGYTQRFSRVEVDETVKRGTINLRLRGESGTQGTTNPKPKLVTQVAISPFISPANQTEQMETNAIKSTEPVETSQSSLSMSGGLPDLDPTVTRNDESGVAKPPESTPTPIPPPPSTPPLQPPLDTPPRYFTRAAFKRKRSDSNVSLKERMHKVIKAMIAQVALGDFDEEFDHALPATEVEGIKIPKTC